jgi:hypothetical protein
VQQIKERQNEGRKEIIQLTKEYGGGRTGKDEANKQ